MLCSTPREALLTPLRVSSPAGVSGGQQRKPRWPLAYVPPVHLRLPTWSYHDEECYDGSPRGGAADTPGGREPGSSRHGSSFATDWLRPLPAFVDSPLAPPPPPAHPLSGLGRTHESAARPHAALQPLPPRPPSSAAGGPGLRRTRTRWNCVPTQDGQLLPETLAFESVSGTAALVRFAPPPSQASTAQLPADEPPQSTSSRPCPPARPLPAAGVPLLRPQHRTRSPIRAATLSRFAPAQQHKAAAALDAGGSPRSPLPGACSRPSSFAHALDAVEAALRLSLDGSDSDVSPPSSFTAAQGYAGSATAGLVLHPRRSSRSSSLSGSPAASRPASPQQPLSQPRRDEHQPPATVAAAAASAARVQLPPSAAPDPPSPASPYAALGYATTPSGARRQQAGAPPNDAAGAPCERSGNRMTASGAQPSTPRRSRLCGMLPPSCAAVRSPLANAQGRLDQGAGAFVSALLTSMLAGLSGAVLEGSPPPPERPSPARQGATQQSAA